MKSYKIYLGDKLIFQQGGYIVSTAACPSGGIKPNEMYDFGFLTAALTITLAPAENPVWDNEWKGRFINTNGSTITWDSSIRFWVKGEPPTFDSNKVILCEFSVKSGIADYSLTDVSST